MREVRQQEAVRAYFESSREAVIAACPRFGKIKVSLDIIEQGGYKNILVLAPRVDIFDGWKKDINKWDSKANFIFSTFKSAKDHLGIPWDLVIIDEIHEASVNQMKNMNLIYCPNKLGLSGTITKQTLLEIMEHLGMLTCYNYSIEQGVSEGILADYRINIHTIPLSRISKTREKSEQKKFASFEYLRKKADSDKKFFWDLKIIKLLQGSPTKLEYTKKLLTEEGRTLVFCGLTEIADKLEVPVYHSKSREKEIFDDFCQNNGVDKLAVIKMAQAGITIVPIRRGIINYTSGNPEDFAQKVCRFLGWEYDNPEKIAELHVLCSDTEFERFRLLTALSFFDKNKIIWK